MTELIERYVAAVGSRLPRAQRADVENELRSSLYDSLEERGDEPPTEDDVVALLAEMGSPDHVATSYRPQSGYLIGPELYPHFRKVVVIVPIALCALLLGAFAISLIVQSGGADGMSLRLLGMLEGLFLAALMSLGIVVIVFAVIQHTGAVELDESAWDPRDLPPVAREADRVGRGEALVGVVVPALLLGLFNLFRDRIGLYVSPDAAPILGDVLIDNLPWINAALLIAMALQAILLGKGRWSGTLRLVSFAHSCFAVYVLHRVVDAAALARPRMLEAGLAEPAADSIVWTGWAIVSISAVATLAGGAWHLYRAMRTPAPRPVHANGEALGES